MIQQELSSLVARVVRFTAAVVPGSRKNMRSGLADRKFQWNARTAPRGSANARWYIGHVQREDRVAYSNRKAGYCNRRTVGFCRLYTIECGRSVRDGELDIRQSLNELMDSVNCYQGRRVDACRRVEPAISSLEYPTLLLDHPTDSLPLRCRLIPVIVA